MINLGVKVELREHFSVIRESLDRIGIANKNKKTIVPLCYILHKTNRDTDESEYYIIHFKNLKKMDGEFVYFTEEDEIKQASIARLLENWELVKIIDKESLPIKNSFVYVLPHKQKKDWSIEHKYNIGNIQ